jgi:hypothetical protein
LWKINEFAERDIFVRYHQYVWYVGNKLKGTKVFSFINSV